MVDGGDTYQVIIAPAANDRLYEHVKFLAQINEAAAERLLDRLIADIRSLADMPKRNPFYNRPFIKANKYRYLMSGRRYRIVYQIEDFTVFVDDIQDCRQSERRGLHYLDQGDNYGHDSDD